MSLLAAHLYRRDVGVTGAFILGWAEAHGDLGITFGDDPASPRSIAYDLGRGLRRKLTRR